MDTLFRLEYQRTLPSGSCLQTDTQKIGKLSSLRRSTAVPEGKIFQGRGKQVGGWKTLKVDQEIVEQRQR